MMLMIAGFIRSTFFFFFNDTATTEIYTLSLHDALPISARALSIGRRATRLECVSTTATPASASMKARSEEHTSELQSPCNLVCRLLLEKKKNTQRLPISLVIAGTVLYLSSQTAVLLPLT